MSHFDVVLFSTDYLPNIGGVETHVHELARALQSLGQRVCVVTVREGSWRHPQSWPSRWIARDGVSILELSLAALPRGHGRLWRLQRSLHWQLRKFLTSNERVVFHCHDYAPYGHRIAEKLKHHARVFTNHTSMFLQDIDDPNLHSLWQQRLRLYDWVVAPSRELARRTADIGYDPERITFIPNGVDVDRFKPNSNLRRQVRKELGVLETDTVVLCARRVVPKNGVIDFAHSLRFLEDYADRLVILFAGNERHLDSYARETIGAVKRCSLSHRVRFLGAVPNVEMHRYYAAADIGVLPSLKEATSIAGLEAMSCGVPLIGTSVGGIPELIDHESTGLLVEPGDPRELACAIRRLVVEPELRQEFGRRARQKVLERFSWESVAISTISTYELAMQAALSRGCVSRVGEKAYLRKRS